MNGTEKPQNPLRLRPSALDRAWYCAESLRPEVAVNPAGEPAELGSAFHEVKRANIEHESQSVAEVAERYGVNVEDLERLLAYAGVAERDLSTWFKDDAAEVPMSHSEPWDCNGYDGLELVGTADRLSTINPELAAVLDWKTGLTEGYVHQQRAYAFLAMRRWPKLKEVYSVTCYVALGYWDGRLYRASDLEAWWSDLKRRLHNGLGQFAPGGHCGYCPRRCECPGVRQYAESCLSTVEKHPAREALTLTAENAGAIGPQLADTLRRVRFIEQRCNEFRDVLRAQVREVGGEIPAGDGKVLRIIETNRRQLDAREAWPILAARLTEEQLADACTISLRKCQDAAAVNAPPGAKGRIRKELEEELDGTGAITVKTVEQMREVQK